jgi:hypothetical protein
MTYTELNAHLEEQITQLPIFYAFSNDQFAEGCKKLAVELPKEELCSLGFGGFILKKAVPAWKKCVEECAQAREDFYSVHENLVDAFRYELANHEYIITMDQREAWDALGLDIDNATEMQCKAFVEAERIYLSTTW